MYKLAVVGNPIKHSLSPEIFALFAKKANISLEYNKILTETKDFNSTVSKFFDSGGLALNITSPYKHEAFLYSKIKTCRSAFCQTSIFYIRTRINY